MHDPIYAACLPCRIAVVKGKEVQIRLVMLNLELLINGKPPPEVTEIAIRVNQAMLDVTVAGATTAF